MIRDQEGIDKTVESFYLSFQRYLGMQADHRAIFIMPKETRIAMARMAGFSVKRVGLMANRIHFTIPFPAHPDQVRIRTGRTFRSGLRGMLEGRLLHPFMVWMNENYVNPRAIQQTLDLLKEAERNEEKVLVFGSWVHLHAIAQDLSERGSKLRLAPGSLIGTGGGLKELYPFTPIQIRLDLKETVELASGDPVPIHDVYGMAEGNWAAMQCKDGNYHIPPWIYAATVDEDNRVNEAPESEGLLAFFDPYGGGALFPAFFRSADQVRLVNGAGSTDQNRICTCGEEGSYLARESIQRVDLLDEAGCAAQV